jgi:hypothetical protein
MSNDKVYVVVGPNFRVKGVYSSYRLALAKVISQKGISQIIEEWLVDVENGEKKDHIFI